jgi:UDP-glucose 4-epimerase
MFNVLIIGSNSNIAKDFCNFLIKKNLSKSIYGIDIQDKSIIKSKKFFYYKYNLSNDASKIKKINEKIDLAIIFSFDLNYKNKKKVNYMNGGKKIINNSLNIIKENEINKVIYLSSMAVYGNQNKTFTEKTKIKPNTIYGELKVISENIVKKRSKNNYKYLIFRLSQIYGKNIKSSWVHKFFNDTKTGKILTIFGNGKQKRDLLHIDDLLNLICKSLRFSKSSIYNVCSEKVYSLNEVLKIFKSKFQYGKAINPKNEVLNIISKNTKIKKEFNWKAKKSLSKKLFY